MSWQIRYTLIENFININTRQSKVLITARIAKRSEASLCLLTEPSTGQWAAFHLLRVESNPFKFTARVRVPVVAKLTLHKKLACVKWASTKVAYLTDRVSRCLYRWLKEYNVAANALLQEQRQGRGDPEVTREPFRRIWTGDILIPKRGFAPEEGRHDNINMSASNTLLCRPKISVNADRSRPGWCRNCNVFETWEPYFNSKRDSCHIRIYKYFNTQFSRWRSTHQSVNVVNFR